jgi:hypothetical protein
MTPAEQGSVVLLGGQLIALAGQFWVFARQLYVFRRQADIMDAQRSVYADQLALARESSEWRRTEAVGAFYRLAAELASELRKGDDALRDERKETFTPDYNTPPRQVLRTASTTFAPLGPTAVRALNTVGLLLDKYLREAWRWNHYIETGELIGDVVGAIIFCREQIGMHLNGVIQSLAPEFRQTDWDGKDYDYRALCSLKLEEPLAGQ